MKLFRIKEILDAKVLVGEVFMDREVNFAFGCDLMSDVLAFVNEGTILLTGLINPQVIRTAEMIDSYAIVFVRGKQPTDEVLEMAKERNITIMTTKDILFTACGKLYCNGLKGVEIEGAQV